MHRYLSVHPDLLLPVQKEIAFFHHDALFEKGLGWYASHFPTAADALYGEVAPQYMYSFEAPTRLHEFSPDVKLIAILRDPVDRAYSAFRMQVRRGLERRTFESFARAAMRQSLSEHVERTLSDETNNYLSASCYGWILQRYFARFAQKQICVLRLADLQTRAAHVMAQVFSFLGVEPILAHPVFGRRFHEGGRARFESLRSLIEQPGHPVRRAFKRLIPASRRRAAVFWLEQWNVKREDPEPLDAKLRGEIEEWFREDTVLLSELLGSADIGEESGFGRREEGDVTESTSQ